MQATDIMAAIFSSFQRANLPGGFSYILDIPLQSGTLLTLFL
jgi:hypothetical protein